jgi:L-ascorbate metabolism protein UlaG (beta-lactamase superfamily)
MVPMHWGTFKLTDEPMDEPPARVARAWQATGRPGDRLWRLAHGETRAL